MEEILWMSGCVAVMAVFGLFAGYGYIKTRGGK